MWNPRDKYGFKSLATGESKIVPGATPEHAQMMCATYVRRYPYMVHKDFVWSAVPGGVKVKRTR